MPQATSVQNILKVERLAKTYATTAGPLTVLHDVSFVIEAGATCAIVGPSGSGKTTLLGLCAGLDQPSQGSVAIEGREIGGLSEDQRALVRNECVGFVFQNFQLIPTLTALENVLVPLELRGGKLSRPAQSSFCSGWVSGAGSIIIRRTYQAVSSSGWGWRARSSTGRGFYFATNRLAISTEKPRT